MTLAELAKLVTALKTSVTHLGIKYEDVTVTVNGGYDTIRCINLEGTSSELSLKMNVDVD